MSRFKYQSFAKDGNGSVITDATVSVYLAGGTTAADVYEASSGGSAVASVTSDGDTGYFYFWVDDSGYTGEQFFKIVISKSSFGSSTLDNIEVLPLLYAGTGTTANRPTVTTEGMYYVDTTISQIVFWDGSAWTLFKLISDSSPGLADDLDLNENNIIYDTAGTYVTSAEIGYLDGLEAIMDTKSPIANPTFTGEIGIGSVNVSETELGILEGATVTTAELNYSDNVTSAIQTQFNNKGVQAWISFNGTGVIATNDSYNVSGITDNGVGDYTVTWDTDFANADYCVVASATFTTGHAVIATIESVATGSISVKCYTDGNNATDASGVFVMAIGAQ